MVVVLVILVLLATLLLGRIENVRANANDTAMMATLNAAREAFVGSPGAPGYLSDMKHVPNFDLMAVQFSDLLDGDRYPLFKTYDVIAGRGWRGPYLSNAQSVLNYTHPGNVGLFPDAADQRTAEDTTFLDRHFYDTSTHSYYGVAGIAGVAGVPGASAAADLWGNPIVLQIPPASEFPNASPAELDALRFHYARIVSAGPNGVLDTPLDQLAGRQQNGNIDVRKDDIIIFLNRADVYATELQEQP